MLIVGAGEAGNLVARELRKNPQLGLNPVPFLDDSIGKWNKQILGIPVRGPLASLETVVKRHAIDDVVIAMPVLPGHGENSIFAVHARLKEQHPGVQIHPVIADVRDAARLDAIFGRFKPDVVFHAAAHKHVPLMEANPEEAFTNNVRGTQNYGIHWPDVDEDVSTEGLRRPAERDRRRGVSDRVPAEAVHARTGTHNAFHANRRGA